MLQLHINLTSMHDDPVHDMEDKANTSCVALLAPVAAAEAALDLPTSCAIHMKDQKDQRFSI